MNIFEILKSQMVTEASQKANINDVDELDGLDNLDSSHAVSSSSAGPGKSLSYSQEPDQGDQIQERSSAPSRLSLLGADGADSATTNAERFGCDSCRSRTVRYGTEICLHDGRLPRVIAVWGYCPRQPNLRGVVEAWKAGFTPGGRRES